MIYEKVTAMVRDMFGGPPVTPQDPDIIDLSIHLRTNDALYETLKRVLTKRITGRAFVVEPSDPIDCKTLLARNGECQWLLNLIERARQLPRQVSEPPAA